MTKAIENKTTEVAIEQLNLSYHVEQDRLLFRVGLSDKTELIVWLTQRIARHLLKLLNGESGLPVIEPENASPSEAVKQFKQEAESFEKLQHIDFATAYQHQQKPAADHTLLATSLNLLEQDPKCLELICLGGVIVNIKLTEELILALTNMLMLSAKEAYWQLAPNKSNSETASIAKSALLH